MKFDSPSAILGAIAGWLLYGFAVRKGWTTAPPVDPPPAA